MVGCSDISEADINCSGAYTVRELTNFCLIHYTLYKADALKKTMFPNEYPYNCAGWGFEDNWLFHSLKFNGCKCASVDIPFLYHNQHSYFRHDNITEFNKEIVYKLRMQTFYNTWGYHDFTPKVGDALLKKVQY
jgi:alpha-N-acetylglucosamine transferase